MLRLIVGLAAVLGSSACAPQSEPATIREAVEAHLAAKQVPGCSVAIFQDGKLAYSEGFGWADVEAKQRVSNRTIFRLGSVSKAVTAVVTMKLVEEGKLSLQDDVRKWVPTFQDKGATITLESLLCHRSGIRHYKSVPESLLDRHYDSLRDATEVFARDPLIAQPGARFSYSTHAYTLLGAALESATGRDFPGLIRDVVPQGSGGSSLGCEVIRLAKPARSRLYEGPAGKKAAEQEPVNNSWKYPGGGMESTAEDLARFGSALLAGKLLNAESLEQMWTAPKFPSSPQPYALGWRPVTGLWGRTVEHGGAQQGCRAHLKLYRDRNAVIVILTNRSDHPLNELVAQIEKIWFAPAIK